MDRLSKLLLIFIIGFALPVYAAEQKVRFEWSYPSEQSTVIDGFKIYNTTAGKAIVATIHQGSLRVYEKTLDLPTGKNTFEIVPFIGPNEGPPAKVDVTVSPFYQIDAFKVKCKGFDVLPRLKRVGF